MSRAKEIQEKLDLQAKIQLSLSKQSLKVADWLNPSNKELSSINSVESHVTNELKHSQMDFFHLPVIQMGAGLNMEEFDSNWKTDDNSKNDIHTIGEFINSDKKVSSLAKKRQYKQSNDPKQNYIRSNIHRIVKDDTKAMIALKRKMRKDIITKQRNSKENGNKHGVTNSSSNRHDKLGDVEDDSDDEDIRSKYSQTKKKTIGLLFQSKKNKKK